MRIFSYLQRVVAVEQSKYLNIVVYDNDDIVVVSCIDIFCFRGVWLSNCTSTTVVVKHF